jgi:hypothetical protein
MKCYSYLFYLLLALGLTSCAHSPLKLLAPSSDKACKAQCTERYNSCTKQCTNSCPQCTRNADQETLVNFLKYAKEEHVQGGAITRNLQSYRDPLECRKVSCSCYNDLMVCNQGCTGTIHKRLQSVPYCA